MKSIHKLKAIYGTNREVTRKRVKSLVISVLNKTERDPSKPRREIPTEPKAFERMT